MGFDQIIPLTCVNGICNRSGIQLFTGADKCSECGGDLFPYEDVQVVERRHKLRQPSLPKKIDTFTCPSDLTGCPIASKPKVFVTLKLYNQWVFLAQQLNTEWIAYLRGKELEEGSYVVSDMYFPKQKASTTHVEAEDRQIVEGTIGAVHSHANMKAFFSGEDIVHFNHPIEIVINSAGECLVNGRTKLECGRWHRGAGELEFLQCDEELALEEQLRSLLTPQPETVQIRS